MLKLKKNDIVKIITGKDKGKIGKIISIHYKKKLILVDGINFIIKHIKPSSKNKQGKIIKKESWIHISNVMFFNKNITRIGFKINNGIKMRFMKNTNKIIN